MKQSEFIWSYDNMVWILPFLYSMAEGNSPFEAEFRVRNKQRNPHAVFEDICCFAARVNNRIDKCGDDGLLARWFYCENHPIDQVAKSQKVSQFEAEKRIDHVIAYISGFQEKPYSYTLFRTTKILCH